MKQNILVIIVLMLLPLTSSVACSLSLEEASQVNARNFDFGEMTNASSQAQFILYETCDVNYEVRISSVNGGLKNTVRNNVSTYTVRAVSTMSDQTLTSDLMKVGGGYLMLLRNLDDMRTHLQQSPTWTPVNYPTTFTLTPTHLKIIAGDYVDELVVEIAYP